MIGTCKHRRLTHCDHFDTRYGVAATTRFDQTFVFSPYVLEIDHQSQISLSFYLQLYNFFVVVAPLPQFLKNTTLSVQLFEIKMLQNTHFKETVIKWEKER